MLIGCGDCTPSTATCDVKVLTAVITCAGYNAGASDGTANPRADPVIDGAIPGSETGHDNYCPGSYDTSSGSAITTCGAVDNIYAWILSLSGAFSNDSSYPWNTFTVGLFEDSTSSAPYKIIGPTSVNPDYGAPSGGSFYATEGNAIAALNGDNGICASAQIVAFRMSGNLFISPLSITGVTEPCIYAEGSGSGCVAGGGTAKIVSTHYIPLPPLDLCAGLGASGEYQVQYTPSQTDGSLECLPAFGGGDYTACNPGDPFFGDDPP